MSNEQPGWQITVTIPCKCGNAARYINQVGQLCCSTCPIKEGLDAIKLADVPALLGWARAWVDRNPHGVFPEVFREDARKQIKALRDIIQGIPRDVEPRNESPIATQMRTLLARWDRGDITRGEFEIAATAIGRPELADEFPAGKVTIV